MFAEQSLVPTIEQAAERSGLSLRSVYRYFPDPESLTHAAVERNMALLEPLIHLHAIGQGTFEDRLAAFVEMRVRFFEAAGPSYRAGVHHEPNIPAVRANLQRTRRAFSEQFARQFALELDAMTPARRAYAEPAADLLSQPDSIDVLRRYRQLTVAETTDVIAAGVREFLT